MVSQRETRKRFIRTALNHLPTAIDQYPPKEQEILHTFLRVLRHYEVDTQEARERFLKQVRGFHETYRETTLYIETPFLWFAWFPRNKIFY